MKFTENHIQGIKAFNSWVKSEINNSEIFSCKPHIVDPSKEEILIFKGKIKLKIDKERICAYDLERGLFATRRNQYPIERILIDCLMHCMEKRFIETYNGHTEDSDKPPAARE